MHYSQAEYCINLSVYEHFNQGQSNLMNDIDMDDIDTVTYCEECNDLECTLTDFFLISVKLTVS